MTQGEPKSTTAVAIDKVSKLKHHDLSDLCDAAEAAIRDGAGFGWLRPPAREAFERYWRGVTVVPERTLFVGRLDGVIAGSVQLVAAPPQKEAWAFACLVDTHFVAPWGRGHGLARRLLEAAEAEARAQGFKVMNLSVRETQTAAVQLYETMGFVHWGTHPEYAMVDDAPVAGRYYCKNL